ncbi:MAG: AAA family ATPase [Chitinispirillaceae bacterium]|nr:AAA family ATPase [Chitinispirillaceae bacterium]
MSDIRGKITRAIAEGHTSQSEIARGCGFSSSVVSSYLSGAYKGDLAKTEAALADYLVILDQKRTYERVVIPFVQTTVSKAIHEILTACIIDAEFGVVCGHSGLGKTFALKQYNKIRPSSILIEVDPTMNQADMLAEICAALKLPGGGCNTMMKMVIDRFYQSDRLLIVDEAEYLSPKCLNTLRRIHDKAEIGVVLCGMPRLVSNLRGKMNDFAQLHLRSGHYINLNNIQTCDTEAIAKTVIKNPSGIILKKLHEECRGNARILSKILKRSVRVSKLNDTEIDTGIIHQIAQSLII